MSADHFEPGGEAKNRDGAWLRAAVEADAASGATFAGVVRRVHAVAAQFEREFKTLGRARLHAQPAPLAFVDVDCNVSSCLRCHSHLVATGSLAWGRCNHLVCSQYW